MRKLFNVLFLVSLLVILVSAPVMAAPALGPTVASLQEAPPVPTLGDLFTTLLSLGGVALFFAALVNAGKKFIPTWFPDGSAPTYTLIFQTAGLVGLVVLQLTGRMDLVPIIDQSAGILANILSSVVMLAYQIYIARKGHQEALAGLPVVGTSYTGRQAGSDVFLFNAELNSTISDEDIERVAQAAKPG